MTNPLETKEKIINILKSRGPCLPVHISSELKISLLFSGAFLSELASDKTIKISNLKVGGSPLYYLPEHKKQLENFFKFLPGREKEAFLLLKEKSILNDSEQTPVIRVALRSIKDFAIPFNYNNKLFWRYFNFSEDEVKKKLEALPIEKPKAEIEKKSEEIIKSAAIIKPEIIIQEKTIDIFEGKKEITEDKPKEKKLKISFIEEIKSSLQAKNIEIINIEKADKKEAIIRVKNPEEYLIIAFNKKKINDKDLIKAYKKAISYSLPYTIMAKEEMPKKMKESIEAHKNLKYIEKL